MNNLFGLTTALKLSFEGWAKAHKQYCILYGLLPAHVLQVVHDAIEEMPIYKPGVYEMWWVSNHNRYIGKCKQRELNLIHEMFCSFLIDFTKGKIRTHDVCKEKEETENKRRNSAEGAKLRKATRGS